MTQLALFDYAALVLLAVVALAVIETAALHGPAMRWRWPPMAHR